MLKKKCLEIIGVIERFVGKPTEEIVILKIFYAIL